VSNQAPVTSLEQPFSRGEMAVQHLSIDDTRAWFLAGDRDAMVGDVLDLATSSAMRVRFGRYAKGAQHEWIVTHEETMIVTQGALRVRFDGGEEVARSGDVIALSKGTRVVYRGEEDGTEVVFVTHMHRVSSGRKGATAVEPVVRPLSSAPRLLPSKPAA
jgi:ethanolamine utilization protein EutQ (cupin superfamily)